MTESLVSFFVNIFGDLTTSPTGKIVSIFLISLMPILELRGGLIAASLLKVPGVIAFITCFIGNLLPIPFILLFLQKIFGYLKKTKLFKGLVEKLEKKALNKKEQVDKYKSWALFIFVAIPLPGTGAWTGALVASVLEMDKKKSFLIISLGVLTAGIIMMFLSYGILSNIIE